MFSRRIPVRLVVLATPVAVLSALLSAPAQAAGFDVAGDTPGVAAAPVAAPAAPVKVKQTAVPTTAATTGSGSRAEVAETGTEDYRLVGVTWGESSTAKGVDVQVRTRTAGVWSDWTDLDRQDDETGQGGRPGSEPLWVGQADGVAARVTSTSGALQDVKIVTVDPGEDDTSAGAAAGGAASTDAASTDAATTDAATTDAVASAGPAVADGVARTTTVAAASTKYPSMPAVITRAQWGASAGGYCSTPNVGATTKGVVIHHTAGANSYSKSESKSMVRAWQSYHIKGQGWCDIGYNFLVDRYGQIFEGRKGGMDRNVRAAHSGNAAVNEQTMGVSMMGNFDTAQPTTAMKDAVVKLVGWRMAATYLKAKGKYSIGGKSLNMIAGHRDVVGTACPGRYAYAWLSAKGGLRDRIEAYLATVKTPIKSRAAALGVSKTGVPYVGEYSASGGHKTRFAKMDLYDRSGTSAFLVSDAGGFRAKYNALTAQSSPLGWPIADTPAVSSSALAIQRFSAGGMYAVPGKGVYSIWGPAYKLWGTLKGSSGKLGLPTSSVGAAASGVTRTTFVGGSIQVVVSTGVATAYDKAGKKISATTPTPTPTTPAPTTPAPTTPAPSSPAAPATPGRVITPTVTSTSSSATFSWPKVSGARIYQVCLVPDTSAKSCTKIVSVVQPSARFTGLKATGGTDWFAHVRASNGSAYGPWSPYRGVNLKPATASASAASTSSSSSVTVPSSRTVSFSGRGYGHGIGMSQYGAQGAARQGWKYSKILSHYYRGTTLSTKTGSIRVLISADTSDGVLVKSQSGLKLRDVSGARTIALPTTIGGKTVDRWEIVPSSSGSSQSKLQYRVVGGSYTAYKLKGSTLTWRGDGYFHGPSTIGLILPNGTTMKLRGQVRSAKPSSGSARRDTVNTLSIDDYVRGVIPAEMPVSWHAEALKAQSVAARTYGVRSMSSSRYYDICSTTACQVYGGASREDSRSNAAVSGTSGKILTYKGAVALAQFSSSSGGYTAQGSAPYLAAVEDPFDGWSGNANRSWKISVKASTVERKYPSIGTLRKMSVTQRTGKGAWGGRVTKLVLTGSKKSVTINGNDARWSFGLRSNWFTF